MRLSRLREFRTDDLSVDRPYAAGRAADTTRLSHIGENRTCPEERR
jgi:hypothetical protein